MDHITNINHLNTSAMIIIILIVGLLILIISLTLMLTLISNYKNKQATTFKNLQYFQNSTIKERLTRIKQIVQTNEQYQPILRIWISRYHQLLKKDLKPLIKSYFKIVKLQEDKAWWSAWKLMKQIHGQSEGLKAQIQLLTTEIDYFISIDQLVREYQLFFKQNFNYLQAETIKINLQNNLNQEQINEIITIINEMFKALNNNVNDANFSIVIKVLGEIAIAVVTLAEILAHLPTLNHLVTDNIKQKMQNLANMCQTNQIDHTLEEQYQSLETNINTKIGAVKRLINNLQYKKAKIQIQEILKNISNFTSKIKQEQIFRKVFQQNYEQFLVINFNFNEILATINLKLQEIKTIAKTLQFSDQIANLQTIINQQLKIFNHIENQLIIENQKSIKTITYEQLLMLLRELFENSIIVFNSLWEYNKLLQQQIKPTIAFEASMNKINSMMLQIDNLLSNINYYYLNDQYAKTFNDLQQTISATFAQLPKNKCSESDLLAVNNFQNQVFQLYNQLKTEIMIHKLTHLTLIYANRHRKMNQQLNVRFQAIEQSINNNYYQKALAQLLELLQ